MAEIYQHPRKCESIDATISPERQPVAWKPWPEGKPQADDDAPYCPPYSGFYHIANLHMRVRNGSPYALPCPA